MTANIEFLFAEAEAHENGLSGVVMPYGELAPRAGYQLQVTQGALAGRMSDVLVNLQHDDRQLLGRTGGNVQLVDTEKKLLISMTYPDTQVGRDAKALVDLGVLCGFSAELQVLSDEWVGGIRRVDKARLNGVALVARPAMRNAQITHNFMDMANVEVLESGTFGFSQERLQKRELRGEMLWNEPSVVSLARQSAVLFEPDSLSIDNPVTLMLGNDYNTSAANSADNGKSKLQKTNKGLSWRVQNMPRTPSGENILQMFKNGLITGWRIGYVASRSRKSKVTLFDAEMDLEIVSEAMWCDARLISDGTGGLGPVAGARRRSRRRS